MKEAAAAGLERAAAVIGSAGSLVATGHVNPDGDALGSALALTLAARRAGLEAQAAFGGGFVLPGFYGFLDLSPLTEPGEVMDSPDALVVFDVADLERIGEMSQVAERAATVVVIDHHLGEAEFGEVRVVDPSAAAAAELCRRLLEALGWEITPPIADALLLGVITDTGRFQYSNTTAATLAGAAGLVELGARPEVICQAVYQSAPFSFLGLAGEVLSRAVLEEEFSLVWSFYTQDDLRRRGLAVEEADGLIDDIRAAREAEVALLVKERPDGKWGASLRSRGRVDVAAIARGMGGGGHARAAGFHCQGGMEEVVSYVRRSLAGDG